MRKSSAQGLAALFSIVIVNLFPDRTVRIVLLSILAILVIVHSKVSDKELIGAKVKSDLQREVTRRSSAAELQKKK